MSPPALYAHPFSSYSLKVLIAFYERGTPFELRLLSSENPSAGAELRALWPLEKFPVLRDGDRAWFESSVIIEWLDRHGPGPGRLIPEDPDAALEVRMLDRVFDNYVMAPTQSIVFDRVRPEGAGDPHGVGLARAQLDRAYAWLDGLVAERAWAAGASFGLADCAAAAALSYANWVHPFDGHGRLVAYFRRLRARPSVARAVDEGRPYRGLLPGGVPAGRD